MQQADAEEEAFLRLFRQQVVSHLCLLLTGSLSGSRFSPVTRQRALNWRRLSRAQSRWLLLRGLIREEVEAGLFKDLFAVYSGDADQFYDICGDVAVGKGPMGIECVPIQLSIALWRTD